MDQHYLPQCYLNEFRNDDGHFFKLDCSILRYDKKPYPLKTTPAAVCYKPNFYTLTDEFKQMYPMYKDLEPFYLENKFHIYERVYPALISKIKTGARFLNSDDAIKFLYSCIDFKIRNFYFRDNVLMQNKRQEIIKKHYNGYLNNESILEYIQKSFKVDRNTVNEIIQTEKSKHLNDPDYAKHSHIATMIDRSQQSSNIYDVIISNFLFYKWNFFKSKNQFITSDNPGWSLDKRNAVHNTRFENGFQFIMPITSSYCLCISDDKIDMNYYNDSTKKLLFEGFASDEMITRINNLSINHFKQYLFASSYEIAIHTAQNIQLRQ